WRGPCAATFPERRAWLHLDANYAVLEATQSLTIDSRDFEWVIVVASGEIELTTPRLRRLPAFSAVRLDARSSLALRVMESPALVIAVEARTAPRGDRTTTTGTIRGAPT